MMEITSAMKDKMITVPVITINGVEIEIEGDFDSLVDDLCSCDGYAAIRGISDDPVIVQMIKAGLVKHHESRGCYGTDLLRANRLAIIDAYYACWGIDNDL